MESKRVLFRGSDIQRIFQGPPSTWNPQPPILVPYHSHFRIPWSLCFHWRVFFPQRHSVPTKTQLSNFLGTPGEDYFKGNPKSLNFYFLVIWWGKHLLTTNLHHEIHRKPLPWLRLLPWCAWPKDSYLGELQKSGEKYAVKRIIKADALSENKPGFNNQPGFNN